MYFVLFCFQRGYQARPLREQTDEYKAANNISNIGSNESDAAKVYIVY